MAITTADIHAAADRIAGSGAQPTLAAVRQALGGGSYTTISEAMKIWREAHEAEATSIREAAPAAVTDRMNALAAEVWGVALGLADDRLASERDALVVARQEMEQAQREVAELADQLAAELDSARAQLARQAEELKQAATLSVQLSEAQEAARTAQATLIEAQKRADGLALLLAQERASTKEAQVKAEQALAAAAHLTGQLEALQRVPDAEDATTRPKGRPRKRV